MLPSVMLIVNTCLGSVQLSSGRTGPQSGVIRAAVPSDVRCLAHLCTDTFYGTHAFWNGPVIYAQHARIFKRIQRQLAVRVDESATCERQLIIAEDKSDGGLIGMVDVAVHLYDTFAERFELGRDAMPEGGSFRFEWRPYVSSLAVQPIHRRKGVASRLMREAERTAGLWDCERAVMLEVETGNRRAIDFYLRQGYRVLERGGAPHTSSDHTQTVVRAGLWWAQRPVEKLLMSKDL